VGTDGEHSFLVMEYLEGEDLQGRLDRGPMKSQELADTMLPVCAAVSVAHEEGIIHRDLKPQNIFLARARDRRVHPKVLDFGISKPTDDLGASLTMSGLIGTPHYMAPEQIRDAKSAGPLSDQYALGLIMYQCATGRRAHDAASLFEVFKSIVDAAYARPRDIAPELPEPVEQVILRAMALDSAARFANVRELGAALLPFASEKTRIVWEGTFGGDAVATPPAPLPQSSRNLTPSPIGMTTPMPPVATTPMPPGGLRSDRSGPRARYPQTDHDAVSLRPATGSRRWFIVGGALVLVGAAAVFALGGSKDKSRATPAADTTETTDQPATPTEPTRPRADDQKTAAAPRTEPAAEKTAADPAPEAESRTEPAAGTGRPGAVREPRSPAAASADDRRSSPTTAGKKKRSPTTKAQSASREDKSLGRNRAPLID
jgi:eukaryotic-like serine/threonine-protein kinase